MSNPSTCGSHVGGSILKEAGGVVVVLKALEVEDII